MKNILTSIHRRCSRSSCPPRPRRRRQCPDGRSEGGGDRRSGDGDQDGLFRKDARSNPFFLILPCTVYGIRTYVYNKKVLRLVY